MTKMDYWEIEGVEVTNSPFFGQHKAKRIIARSGDEDGDGGQGRRDRTERMRGAWGTGGSREEDGGVEAGRATEMIERLKIKMNEKMNERLRVAMEEYNREMIEEVEKEMRR